MLAERASSARGISPLLACGNLYLDPS
jgi:hypothetical protein